MELEKLKDMLCNAAGGPTGIQMCHEAADAINQFQKELDSVKADAIHTSGKRGGAER